MLFQLICIEKSLSGEGVTAERDTSTLQELCDAATAIIKDCGNACDAYSKKPFAYKLMRSSKWDRRFAGFISQFQDMRRDFDKEISMISFMTIIQVHQNTESMHTE